MSHLAFSFGAGTQSSAGAQLVLDGRLPRPDLWQFADTGEEPPSVYANLALWKELIEAEGMKFQIVRAEETLSQHVLNRAENGIRGISMPPMYVNRRKRGGRMPVWRGCTRDFKTRLMDKAAKEYFNVPRGCKKAMVTRWLGISTDEAHRMGKAEAPWFEKAYPLIDLGLSRTDCEGILLRNNRPVVRSACSFCPFHSDREWQRLKMEEPEAFAAAVRFERKMWGAWEEHGGIAGLETRPSLHESGLPLDEVDFTKGQGNLFGGWGNDCAGVCGV